MVDVAMDMDPFGVVIVVGGVSAVPPCKTRREPVSLNWVLVVA